LVSGKQIVFNEYHPRRISRSQLWAVNADGSGINVTAEHWFEDRVAPDLGLSKNAHFVQMFGNPATGIVSYARETSADLIVMNVHGAHPRLAGRLPGVAYRVVIEAPCPVLTVR
jgi:nucleotide-binding universal stress UspA family protein